MISLLFFGFDDDFILKFLAWGIFILLYIDFDDLFDAIYYFY